MLNIKTRRTELEAAWGWLYARAPLIGEVFARRQPKDETGAGPWLEYQRDESAAVLWLGRWRVERSPAIG